MADPVVKKGTPDLVTPTPTAAELDEFLAKCKMLDDADGFGLNELRVFYKKDGWNILTARMNALVAAGKISERFKQSPNGKGGWNVYRVTSS